jgi:hypothetical protein
MSEFARNLAEHLKPVKPFFPPMIDTRDLDYEEKLAQAHRDAEEADWTGFVAVVVEAALPANGDHRPKGDE